ncbi:hypothetical protein BGZ95_005630 [Linnemannia exigua]|uniref:RING-type E3 ubiquitin transferase BRCA1 n=1 Tax=Linnemannia exigua TaxID=604196 RepID=A0AAD4DH15_9FUNG|nr:hypothetical protein BGZ95_005630 [Linnemannia exigua]
MHAVTKTYNHKSTSQDEGEYHGEQEILPNTTIGILRRMAEEIRCPICLGTMERPMSTGCNHTFCHECILHALSRSDGCPLCKTHVHKRGLNRVDHLEQVIEAFNQLKEAFEQEDGHTLSQAPRHYDAEPEENLTQLYPYPEKIGESSFSSGPTTATSIAIAPTARAPTEEPALAIRQLSAQFSSSPSATQSTLPEQSQQLDKVDVPSDMDCFDVNLDSVSADQAALLAEKMLAMISLSPPNESSSTSTVHLASSSASGAPQNRLRARSVVVKQESDADEEDDDPTQPRQDQVQVKTEPLSSLEDSASFFNGPTQERASKETSVLLCGTYLAPQKKTRMDSAAKILKGKLVNDLATSPTHVVMDITQEQCQKGAGRTVKFFMGILHASWVVRYDWLVASQAAGYWVDETSYQISDNEMGCNPAKLSRASRSRGDPPLFTNFEFQLAGTFVTPTRDEIELMIKTGGGIIVPKLFQRDRSAAVNNGSFTRHVLLYDQASEGVMSLKKLRSEIEAAQLQGHSIGKVVAYDMDKLVESIPF